MKDDYWGLCPDCHGTPVFTHNWKENWATCGDCRTRWLVGIGLFSMPDYDQEYFEREYQKLATYREVKPWYTWRTRLQFRVNSLRHWWGGWARKRQPEPQESPYPF